MKMGQNKVSVLILKNMDGSFSVHEETGRLVMKEPFDTFYEAARWSREEGYSIKRKRSHELSKLYAEWRNYPAYVK
jgi:hypothetical protein